MQASQIAAGASRPINASTRSGATFVFPSCASVANLAVARKDALAIAFRIRAAAPCHWAFAFPGSASAACRLLGRMTWAGRQPPRNHRREPISPRAFARSSRSLRSKSARRSGPPLALRPHGSQRRLEPSLGSAHRPEAVRAR
jgi:hypothetical protein